MAGVAAMQAGQVKEVTLASRDELGTLAAAFNRMAHLIEDREAKLKQALSEIWGEMNLAHRIQTALVPAAPVLPGFDVACHMTTATEVGGDYYDVISTAEGHWVVIGDVSGHGVTAGLVMMMARTAIRTAIESAQSTQGATPTPAAVLAVTNRTLVESIQKLGLDKYMTISLLQHRENGHFLHAGLHLDLLVLRRDGRSVERYETTGCWLGIDAQAGEWLENHTLQLDPGDILVLYTDGVTEAMKNGELFGERRLENVLLEAASRGGPQEIRQSILAAIADWEKPDDVTVVVLRRQPADYS